MVRPPGPASCPPLKLIWPLTESPPLPARLPLFRKRVVPASVVEALPMVRVAPLLISRVGLLVKELPRVRLCATAAPSMVQ
jgi:hypothetical protein